MNDFVAILLSGLGVIITGLCGWVVAWFTKWIEQKVKDKETAEAASEVARIVTGCVQEIYQSFVESLKEEGKFDAEKQKEALNACLIKVKAQLSEKAQKYLELNFADIDSYLITMIESTIYSLKQMWRK